ncbi:RNA polymerase sigma factor [Larkinella humicola]|uniref:Sigma-70 family RNA polymerase sigma factor n=1 Tax=Larkinella humicola TaxID=2607654 RepID=A0A5N1JA78_9BACT|nr:sigma-70 family RNA polymerase sigma factor [Larkinella humicola]KAA9347166.1 sigma-70 family RNA polymerase sigma factor [Larkinella humicola]
MDQKKHPFNRPAELVVWQQFLSGDTVAFAYLMSSHFQVLFRYGSKFSKDKEFVKDCIQDLFLIIWERRDRLSAEVAVKPYLMASLRRLMNRSGQSRTGLSDELPSDNEEVFDIEYSVEEEYIEQENVRVITQRFKKLLNELPKRQKEVIYLKFFQEMDRNQISEVMDISPQTVSNLLQIAIRQLKEYWKVEFLTLLLAHFYG